MRNCHLTRPPAPASSLSRSQFLNGLSFSLSLSPVLCQAGRLVSWGQTKGWFSSGPVSRSPNRLHGSLGRRHQTWLVHKGKSHTQETMADGLKKTELQSTNLLPLPHPCLQKVHRLICRKRISSFTVHKSYTSLVTRKSKKMVSSLWDSELCTAEILLN